MPDASVSVILRGETGEKTQTLAVAEGGGGDCNVSCYSGKEQRVSFKTASCGGKKNRTSEKTTKKQQCLPSSPLSSGPAAEMKVSSPVCCSRCTDASEIQQKHYRLKLFQCSAAEAEVRWETLFKPSASLSDSLFFFYREHFRTIESPRMMPTQIYGFNRQWNVMSESAELLTVSCVAPAGAFSQYIACVYFKLSLKTSVPSVSK